jgi:hypothetical protein
MTRKKIKMILYKCTRCEKTFNIPEYIHLKYIESIAKNLYCIFCNSNEVFSYEYSKNVKV